MSWTLDIVILVAFFSDLPITIIATPPTTVAMVAIVAPPPLYKRINKYLGVEWLNVWIDLYSS